LSSKIKIAVILDQVISVGGGFQQAMNNVNTLLDMSSEKYQFIFFSVVKQDNNLVKPLLINPNFLEKISLFLRRFFLDKKLYKFLKLIRYFQKYNYFEKALIENNIDLVYFLSSNVLANDLEELNYIITVWDLAHLEHPEFPEVRFNREFEKRNNALKKVLPKATSIIVDSEMGRENVSNFFNIKKEKIHILNFSPASHLDGNTKKRSKAESDTIKKYNFNRPYIFYPAQFWSHKNHIYILEGLKILEKKYRINFSAIFTGTDKGNLGFVKEKTKSLKLAKRIVFPGFVSDSELRQYYIHSFALVMPTFFGPTNLPPLEAFKLGVPVLYPDLPGLRDQVGGAAILLDLSDPESLAKNLKLLYEDKNFKRNLIESGKKRLVEINHLNRQETLLLIFDNFALKLKTWKSP